MTFIELFSVLHELFIKGKTFKGFVDKLADLEKVEMFTQIGNSHWTAACEHLSNVRFHDDISKDEVLLAIGALEQAYQLYMHARPKGWRIFSWEMFFFGKAGKFAQCSLLGCTVSLFQSRCYKHLEAKERVKKYAERAMECFEEYANVQSKIDDREASLLRRDFTLYYLKDGTEGKRAAIFIERRRGEMEEYRRHIQDIIKYLYSD